MAAAPPPVSLPTPNPRRCARAPAASGGRDLTTSPARRQAEPQEPRKRKHEDEFTWPIETGFEVSTPPSTMCTPRPGVPLRRLGSGVTVSSTGISHAAPLGSSGGRRSG